MVEDRSHSATHQRMRQLRQHKHCQHLRDGLDWHVYTQIQRKAKKEQTTALKTWVQGAIRYTSPLMTNALCAKPRTSITVDGANYISHLLDREGHQSG